jgi:hypothetical protein
VELYLKIGRINMNKNKIKEVQKFLKELEDPSQMMGLVIERLPHEVLVEINNYIKLIVDVKHKAVLNTSEIIYYSMIIGYLLKGHIDRFELEESLNDI